MDGSKELHPSDLIQRAVEWLSECSQALEHRHIEGSGKTSSEAVTSSWVPTLGSCMDET